MAEYEIRIKRSASKEIDAIGMKADRKRIVARILSLSENPLPTGCQKLSGDGRYRIRQGRYRILYTIDDDVLIIEVIKVANRSTAYRRQS